MQLITTYSTGKQARFYIDGKRVSKEKFEYTMIKARIDGKEHNTFHTKAWPLANGGTKRRNYSSIN